MPGRRTNLSPAAAEKQKAAIREWKRKNLVTLGLSVRRERRDAYNELAKRRGTSLRGLVIRYLEGECEKEGI